MGDSDVKVPGTSTTNMGDEIRRVADQADAVRRFSTVHDVKLGLAHRILVFCDWDEVKSKQMLDIFREMR